MDYTKISPKMMRAKFSLTSCGAKKKKKKNLLKEFFIFIYYRE